MKALKNIIVLYLVVCVNMTKKKKTSELEIDYIGEDIAELKKKYTGEKEDESKSI